MNSMSKHLPYHINDVRASLKEPNLKSLLAFAFAVHQRFSVKVKLDTDYVRIESWYEEPAAKNKERDEVLKELRALGPEKAPADPLGTSLGMTVGDDLLQSYYAYAIAYRNKRLARVQDKVLRKLRSVVKKYGLESEFINVDLPATMIHSVNSALQSIHVGFVLELKRPATVPTQLVEDFKDAKAQAVMKQIVLLERARNRVSAAQDAIAYSTGKPDELDALELRLSELIETCKSEAIL